MTGYILRRLAALVPALFFVSVVTFAITLLLPGDPALAYIGEANINDRAMYLAVRQELGLDQPLPVQYLKWLGRAVQGDLGRSVQPRGAGFGLAVIGLVLLLALGASLIAPYVPSQMQPAGILAAPSLQHPLGTDAIGRDVLSRIVHGARVSILAGVVSVGFALTLGVLIGLVAGYYGGWVDDLLMRLIDAIYSFPALLALAITAVLGPGLTNAMLAVGIVFTPSFARLVRGQALSVREREFVMAARVTGARAWRIMAVHIWPNVTAPIIVQASLQVAAAIVVEAGLSFLGLGVQPPTPSWGSMLKEGYQYMEPAPWLAFAPGAAIFLTVLAFNLFGDGLRHALDPRLARREL